MPHAPTRPMILRNPLLAAALLACLAPPVFAQAVDRQAERRARQASGEAQKPEATAVVKQYPAATREEPEAKASAKMGPRLNKVFEAYEGGDATVFTPLADAIIDDPKANAYERAIAARLAGAGLVGTDDAKARAYLAKAVEIGGLNNNEHFDTMIMLGQLQVQDELYAEGLATIDAFLAGSGSQKPEHLVVKGNALYRLDRFAEAAAVLKQAIEASPEPKNDWMQLLMGTYAALEQPEEAAKIAEGLMAKSPDDKRLQMNLVSIYMQNDQSDKAIALLEQLRAGGKLTEDRDFRNLYAIYLNAEGKEAQAIGVINDGLGKGVLKPDHQTYLALAQAYYFSDKPKESVEAYRKAAPLAPDGETYLNLAKVLSQEGQIGDAKKAAEQALAKGVRNPADAKKIVALPGN